MKWHAMQCRHLQDHPRARPPARPSNMNTKGPIVLHQAPSIGPTTMAPIPGLIVLSWMPPLVNRKVSIGHCVVPPLANMGPLATPPLGLATVIALAKLIFLFLRTVAVGRDPGGSGASKSPPRWARTAAQSAASLPASMLRHLLLDLGLMVAAPASSVAVPPEPTPSPYPLLSQAALSRPPPPPMPTVAAVAMLFALGPPAPRLAPSSLQLCAGPVQVMAPLRPGERDSRREPPLRPAVDMAANWP